MNRFSTLLQKSIEEILEFENTSPEFSQHDRPFFNSLVESIKYASKTDEGPYLEKLLKNISHSIVDSGPVTSDFSSSLNKVIDAFQRLESNKKKNR